MNNKIQIHEFDPVIYPLKLWIIKNPTVSFLTDNFGGIDEEFHPVEMKNSNASVWDRPVMLKETKKYGLLLSVYDMKSFTADTMAHEATHMADILWGWINEKELSMRSEANAYLVGWMVKCMCEFKSYKNKK